MRTVLRKERSDPFPTGGKKKKKMKSRDLSPIDFKYCLKHNWIILIQQLCIV